MVVALQRNIEKDVHGIAGDCVNHAIVFQRGAAQRVEIPVEQCDQFFRRHRLVIAVNPSTSVNSAVIVRISPDLLSPIGTGDDFGHDFRREILGEAAPISALSRSARAKETAAVTLPVRRAAAAGPTGSTSDPQKRR